MSCSNVPIELVLATSDPNLFDAQTKQWLWSGQLWWAVECLPHGQSTVSDRIPPRIKPGAYSRVTTSPTTWNYCNSINCTATSDMMLIVFTFNPASKDPNDFLQYVIDIHCNVTDVAAHDIKDASGQALFLDIVEVSKMTREPYVEIWIAKTRQNRALGESADTHAIHQFIQNSTKIRSNTWLWIVIGLIIALFVIIVVGISGYLYLKPKTN